MKRDLDHLMKKVKIDAIYAEGSSSGDATMYYLLNGANVSGRYIKKIGRPALIIHSPIEREEAAKGGLKLININRYDGRKIFEKHSDRIKAAAVLTNQILDDLDIKGRIAFYGSGGLGAAYNYLSQIIRQSKNRTIARESEKSIISYARETKDDEEIARMKKVRNNVISAFNTMLRTVRTMKVKHNVIWQAHGKKLRIKDLKMILRRELFANDLVNSAGLIVAQGRDAGIPHNSGEDHEPVTLGKTIVFDIYPQELLGGYFFDFTRTVCFGYAPKEIIDTYRMLKDGQDYIIEKLGVGKKTNAIEKLMCQFFEKHGHATFLSNPKTQSGYCHSLGHGLGLNVHESPSFSLLKTNKDTIKPGMIFTIEPGVYYPEKGFGLRLEDVIYVNKRGKIINLTNYPRTLVVEL